MKTIDINKARKARAAKREKDQDEPVVVLIGDENIKLADEVSAEFAFLGGEGDTRGAVREALGVHADAFFAQKPTLADIEFFMESLAEVYGFDSMGESSASAGSS